MTWTMLAVVCLVVPGWSGAGSLDKTGTTVCTMGIYNRDVLKNTAPVNPGSEDTEREGFEPSIALRLYRFSRPTHSTTLPPLRRPTFVTLHGRKTLVQSPRPTVR